MQQLPLVLSTATIGNSIGGPRTPGDLREGRVTR